MHVEDREKFGWERHSSQAIGRTRSEHLEELSAQIGSCGTEVVLYLEGVTLVDADVIRFLGAREKEIKILRCSLDIREWIRREAEESSREWNA